MDLRASLTLSNLQMPHPTPQLSEVRTADEVAKRVFARAEETSTPMRYISASEWKNQWLQSDKFHLREVPLHLVACPRGMVQDSTTLGCIQAAGSFEPIIVDMNKNKVGISMGRFYPPVIVIDGEHRHTAMRLAGRETIQAWVGDLAAEAMGLDHQDPPKETKKEVLRLLRKGSSKKSIAAYLKISVPQVAACAKEFERKGIDIHAASKALVDEATKIRERIARLQSSTIERAMRLYAARSSGGMGGAPSASLSQGSGPGPSIAMKPRPTPGGATVTPMLKSRGGKRRKKVGRLKSDSGYFGYKDATDTQRQKTKGATGSDMTRKLKGSGYFGYSQDATATQSQKTKGGTKSEMTSKLKGAAEKVNKIVTDYKHAVKGGYKPRLEAVAPPGMESTVKGLKKHFPESSAFRLAWYMYDKKKSGKKHMQADFVPSHKKVDLHEKMPRAKVQGL